MLKFVCIQTTGEEYFIIKPLEYPVDTKLEREIFICIDSLLDIDFFSDLEENILKSQSKKKKV